MSVPLQAVLHGSQLLVSFHAGFLELPLLEAPGSVSDLWLRKPCCWNGAPRADVVMELGVCCELLVPELQELASVSTADSSVLLELLWPPFINQ